MRLVLAALFSLCFGSGVLLHDQLFGNNSLGDIWSVSFTVQVSDVHSYTIESAILSDAEIFVDDHIGVAVDDGPFDYFNFYTENTNCTIRGARSITNVATLGLNRKMA